MGSSFAPRNGASGSRRLWISPPGTTPGGWSYPGDAAPLGVHGRQQMSVMSLWTGSSGLWHRALVPGQACRAKTLIQSIMGVNVAESCQQPGRTNVGGGRTNQVKGHHD